MEVNSPARNSFSNVKAREDRPRVRQIDQRRQTIDYQAESRRSEAFSTLKPKKTNKALMESVRESAATSTTKRRQSTNKTSATTTKKTVQ